MESANRWRPFCCERCRMADLGDWLSEGNRIPALEDDPSMELPDDAGFPVNDPMQQ
ncbi:MAG: DNA gyrase inhibitor YacG [Gammaproteobacteria bacterium]|nr:MAG: DNA gyrase inhibitor YacG [Gammaproteobacteria bacterium]